MKKFYSLLKKEHHDFKSWHAISLIASLFTIFVVPSLIKQFTPVTLGLYELRAIFIGLSVGLFTMMPIMQFITSIRISIKQKDIWLHNSSSIITLLVAKLIYPMIAIIVCVAVLSTSFHFIGHLIEGSVLQIVTFMLVIIFTVLFTYFLCACLLLIGYAFSAQLKQYIGRLSTFITFIVAIIILNSLDQIPNEDWLTYGHVSLNGLMNYLPRVQGDFVNIAFTGDFYMVQEISGFLLLIACFVLAAKWLERVITH